MAETVVVAEPLDKSGLERYLDFLARRGIVKVLN
jgi:hypothetical protein